METGFVANVFHIIVSSFGWSNVLIIARLCNNQRREGQYRSRSRMI